jgi:uncharacterized damage-inducible protein DinB
MEAPLVKLVRHCTWANGAWIDFIADNCPADEYLLQRMSHILLGEQAWFQRLDGRDPDRRIWNVMAMPELREKQKEHQGIYAESMNGDLGRVIEYARFTGERYQSPVSDILLHLTLHGTHHRGQMAVYVSGKGLKPVHTDFIQFCLLNKL